MADSKDRRNSSDDEVLAEQIDAPLVALDGAIPLLGKITVAFASCDFYDAITSTLDMVCETLGADNAEIFFSEPEGSDLLLTACQGRDREALVEQVRFSPGSGFPGRVTANQQPLMSTNLAADPRYLRQSVVRCGINAYACVPLRAPRGLSGSLNAAWREPPESMEEPVQLLEFVASVISTHIAARLSELRCLVDQAMESAADRSQAERLRLLLGLVVEMTGTPRAAVRLLGEEDADDVLVVHGLPNTCGLSARSSACPCDIVEGGHGDLVGANLGGCGCKFPPMMENPGRLSMNYGGEAIGCIVVDFDTDLPVPATRELLPLLVVAQQAALHLRRATGAGTPGRLESESTKKGAALEIYGLGSMQIACNGELIESDRFPRRAALDLLKVLAIQAGKPISADQLIEIFWPECNYRAGKNRLNVALHSLRSVLEPDGGRGEWQFVRTSQGHYYLGGDERVWLDFEEFESTWKEIERMRSRREPIDGWRPLLEKTLDLYRGDLFMENRYDDWCEGRRIYLRRLYLKALTLFVDVLVEGGEFDAALDYLRRGLAIDEFDDTLNRRLIEVLLATGRRRLAQEQYEIYVRRLYEELGCEPMPATADLGELLELARQDFRAAREQLEL